MIDGRARGVLAAKSMIVADRKEGNGVGEVVGQEEPHLSTVAAMSSSCVVSMLLVNRGDITFNGRVFPVCLSEGVL